MKFLGVCTGNNFHYRQRRINLLLIRRYSKSSFPKNLGLNFSKKKINRQVSIHLCRVIVFPINHFCTPLTEKNRSATAPHVKAKRSLMQYLIKSTKSQGMFQGFEPKRECPIAPLLDGVFLLGILPIFQS